MQSFVPSLKAYSIEATACPVSQVLPQSVKSLQHVQSPKSSLKAYSIENTACTAFQVRPQSL